MAEESDGIEEALEGTVRLAVMAGARIGSEIARAREERLRDQRFRDERETAQLAQRFEAEKRVAVAELSQVHRPDWWDRADAARIGQTYATARAWAPEAPEARGAERKMRDELQARYGIDVDRLDPRSVSAEVETWRQRLEEQRRQEADQQRTAETAERAEAAVLLDQAVREDQRGNAARDDEHRTDAPAADVQASDGQASEPVGHPWLNAGHGHDDAGKLRAQAAEDLDTAKDSAVSSDGAEGEAGRLYDSAERRAADAGAMEAQGVEHEVAETRMRADTGRAKPATLATTGAGHGRAPKARKASKNRGAQIERAGVER